MSRCDVISCKQELAHLNHDVDSRVPTASVFKATEFTTLRALPISRACKTYNITNTGEMLQALVYHSLLVYQQLFIFFVSQRLPAFKMGTLPAGFKVSTSELRGNAGSNV